MGARVIQAVMGGRKQGCNPAAHQDGNGGCQTHKDRHLHLKRLLEYWHCETCGKNFADEAGQQELTIGTEIAALGHEIVKTDAKEPTATEPENIAYWYCQRCGKYFQDEALTQEITKEQTILASTGEMIPSAPQEEQTSEDNSNDSPQTGDNTNIIFLSSVMLIAGAVLIGVYVYIQRRKRNNNL